jgi:diguanylate cyclase (GGDEF)-like protein
MPDSVSIDNLFRDSADLFVLLGTDRKVKTANPAFRQEIRGARPGADFLDLVDPQGRDRFATALARAAGGATVLVEIDHESTTGGRRRVEYRFFPVEGGFTAGVGRLRAIEPAMADQLDRVSEELREKTRILDHIQIELTQVPFIDPVTGVWNRLQVVERLTGEWSRSERFGSPITALIVEVEDMPEIRSRHGQFVSDEVLKSVARRIKRTVRDHDVVGRYGGDRFVVVAVTDGDGAKALGGRLRDAISLEPVAVNEKRIPVTMRVGGATNRSEGVEIMEDIFSVAETALEESRKKPERVAVAEEVGV